jgi:autonomous glycyl radical cofactor GrcA
VRPVGGEFVSGEPLGLSGEAMRTGRDLDVAPIRRDDLAVLEDFNEQRNLYPQRKMRVSNWCYYNAMRCATKKTISSMSVDKP